MTDPEKAIPSGSMPPKEDTVPEPEEKAPEKPDPKVYAGKYKSPEDLEKAYGELEKKLGEQGASKGEMERQLKTLMEQNQFLTQIAQQQKREPEPTDTTPNLNSLVSQYEAGDLALEDVINASTEIAATKAYEKAAKQFQDTLRERDAETARNEFLKNNPDFLELQLSGAFNEMKKANPLHDDFSAYFELKAKEASAEREQAIQEALERGKREQAELETGDEATKTTLADAGTSVQRAQNKSKPLKPDSDDMTESMLSKLKSMRG